MKHSEPERVTPKLLAELRRIDPEHLMRELGLIEAFLRPHPELPHVACFDTAFHSAVPRVTKLLPMPRRYLANGVENLPAIHSHGSNVAIIHIHRALDVEVVGATVVAPLSPGGSRNAVASAVVGVRPVELRVPVSIALDLLLGRTLASGCPVVAASIAVRCPRVPFLRDVH